MYLNEMNRIWLLVLVNRTFTAANYIYFSGTLRVVKVLLVLN
jgi:hypothetical protein